MPSIFVEIPDSSSPPLLVAEERLPRRVCFRSLDPRHVAIADVDLAGGSEEAALVLLENLIEETGGRWRAYRTAGGLRYIEMSRPWWPRTSEVRDAFEYLTVDPVYLETFVLSFREGRESGTFSARIDPKPWRMVGYPTQAEFREMDDITYGDWLDNYTSDAPDYRTCLYLETYGDPTLPVHPWSQLVVDYHDVETRALIVTSDPLA